MEARKQKGEEKTADLLTLPVGDYLVYDTISHDVILHPARVDLIDGSYCYYELKSLFIWLVMSGNRNTDIRSKLEIVGVSYDRIWKNSLDLKFKDSADRYEEAEYGSKNLSKEMKDMLGWKEGDSEKTLLNKMVSSIQDKIYPAPLSIYSYFSFFTCCFGKERTPTERRLIALGYRPMP